MGEAALAGWVSSFTTVEAALQTLQELKSGEHLLLAMSEFDCTVDVSSVKRGVGDADWPLAAANLKKLVVHLEQYYRDVVGEHADLSHIDPSAVARDADPEQLTELVECLIGCVIKLPDNQAYIGRIMGMEEDAQDLLMTLAQRAMSKFSALDAADPAQAPREQGSPSPVSPTPNPYANPYEDPPQAASSAGEGEGEGANEQLMENYEALGLQHAELKRELAASEASLAETAAQLAVAQEAAEKDDSEWLLKEMEYSIQEKSQEVEALQREIERKERAAEEQIDELDVLRAKAKKVDSAQKKADAAERQIAQIKSKIDELNDTKVRLTEASELREAAENDAIELRNKMKQAGIRSKRQAEEQQAEAERMARELEELQQAKAQQELAIKRLHDEKAVMAAAGNATSLLDGLADEEDTVAADELRLAEERAAKCQEEAAQLRQQLGAAKERALGLESELSTWQAKAQQAQSSASAASSADALGQDLEAEKARHEVTRGQLHAQGEDREEEKEAMDTLYTTKCEELRQLVEAKGVLERQKEKLQADSKRLKDYLRQAKNVIEKQQQKIITVGGAPVASDLQIEQDLRIEKERGARRTQKLEREIAHMSRMWHDREAEVQALRVELQDRGGGGGGGGGARGWLTRQQALAQGK